MWPISLRCGFCNPQVTSPGGERVDTSRSSVPSPPLPFCLLPLPLQAALPHLPAVPRLHHPDHDSVPVQLRVLFITPHTAVRALLSLSVRWVVCLWIYYHFGYWSTDSCYSKFWEGGRFHVLIYRYEKGVGQWLAVSLYHLSVSCI